MNDTITAYQGANGWYTATADSTGTHGQPSLTAHGTWYESAAEALAAHQEKADVSEAPYCECGDCDDCE